MKIKNIDYALFFTILSLIVFGMIMISSVSVYQSFKITSIQVARGILMEPNNHFYLIRNISHVCLSLLLFAFVVKVPYSWFEKYAKQSFFFGIFLLIIVLFVGAVYNGAKGWIDLPFLPFSLQPVEFMKIAMVTFFAYFLKRKRAEIETFQGGFIPFMLMLFSIIFLLALQPDFGSILLMVPVAIILFFVGGGNIRHLAISGVIFSVFALSIYGIGHTVGDNSENSKLNYISKRIDNFLANNQTAIQNKTINFQTEQGLIAIGSGGFFGLGFGESVQKFGYLPEVQGDFIFSVIAEELGFVGIFVLVSAYGFIAYRGFRIARLVDDPFGKYTAIGITSVITIQAFVNMGVNLNIVPLTGVTLPFVSYGGSSLMSLLIATGLLLNISRHMKYEDPNRRSAGIGITRNVIRR